MRKKEKIYRKKAHLKMLPPIDIEKIINRHVKELGRIWGNAANKTKKKKNGLIKYRMKFIYWVGK